MLQLWCVQAVKNTEDDNKQAHLNFPIYALLPWDRSSASREIMYSTQAPYLYLRAAKRNFPLSTSAARIDDISWTSYWWQKKGGKLESKEERLLLELKNLLHKPSSIKLILSQIVQCDIRINETKNQYHPFSCHYNKNQYHPLDD